MVLIEPWSSHSTFNTGTSHLATYEGEDIKIARLDTSEARANVSVFDMSFLVAKKGEKIRFFEERHELAEFEHERFLNLMHDARLRARFIARGLVNGPGLYLGVKK